MVALHTEQEISNYSSIITVLDLNLQPTCIPRIIDTALPIMYVAPAVPKPTNIISVIFCFTLRDAKIAIMNAVIANATPANITDKMTEVNIGRGRK